MSDPTDPTLTSLHIYPDDTLRDGQRVHYGGSDRFDVSRAEYERMRAMFSDAPLSTEQNCYTCAFCPKDPTSELCAPHASETGGAVNQYVADSGCNDAPDGMPTNRALSCPGHAPKVTT